MLDLLPQSEEESCYTETCENADEWLWAKNRWRKGGIGKHIGGKDIYVMIRT